MIIIVSYYKYLMGAILTSLELVYGEQVKKEEYCNTYFTVF